MVHCIYTDADRKRAAETTADETAVITGLCEATVIITTVKRRENTHSAEHHETRPAATSACVHLYPLERRLRLLHDTEPS